MIRPPRITVVLPLWMLAIVFAASTISLSEERSSLLSPSPLNPFFAGTSRFYSDLSQEYRVVLGGPETAYNLVMRGVDVAYFLVGPDKPLTSREVEVLADAYKTGRLSVLVADETGNSNNLLRALGAPRVDGRIPGVGSGGGWELMVKVECYGVGEFYTGLASSVLGGSPICVAQNGEILASKASRIIVVGDSSLFANYLYDGYDGLPPTQPYALYLAGMAAGNSTVIVYDDSHYDVLEAGLGLKALPRLLASIARAAHGAASSLQGPEGLAILAVASIPWAAIFSPPTTPSGGVKSEVEEAVRRLREALEEGRRLAKHT